MKSQLPLLTFIAMSLRLMHEVTMLAWLVWPTFQINPPILLLMTPFVWLLLKNTLPRYLFSKKGSLNLLVVRKIHFIERGLENLNFNLLIFVSCEVIF